MAESIGGPSGFWSYVHRDNEQAGERIHRLADRIRDEFSLLSGADLELFLDRDSLVWGDQWRGRVEAAIQETTFFIPIVTPRYFTSEECRKELMKFAAHARSVGATELLLPILYVDVPDLVEDSPDDAMALIASTQYVDWRELRLTDEASETYARAVNQLAQRLAQIARDYASRPSVIPTESSPSTEDPDDEPGISDLIADMEPVLPKWTETIEGFAPILEQIQTITMGATDKFQNEGQDSFAKRVLVARQFAADLSEPAEELLGQGEQYARLLISIDPGVRAIIALAGDQSDPEDIQSACEMFESLRGLVRVSQENEVALKEFIASLRQPARLFKDVRPPLAKMESGMRSVLDAQTVMNEWIRLMDESALDCSAQPSS